MYLKAAQRGGISSLIRKSVLLGVLAGFPSWQGLLEASLSYGRNGDLTHQPPIFWRPRVNKEEMPELSWQHIKERVKRIRDVDMFEWIYYIM